jgi:hypothetical protein
VQSKTIEKQIQKRRTISLKKLFFFFFRAIEPGTAFIRYEGKIHHEACFVCFSCKKLLDPSSFYNVNGKVCLFNFFFFMSFSLFFFFFHFSLLVKVVPRSDHKGEFVG